MQWRLFNTTILALTFMLGQTVWAQYNNGQKLPNYARKLKKQPKIPKKNSFKLRPGEVRHFPLDFAYNPDDVKIISNPPDALAITHRPKDGIITLKGQSTGTARIFIPTPGGKSEVRLEVGVGRGGQEGTRVNRQSIDQKLQSGNAMAKSEALDTFINTPELSGSELSAESRAAMEKLIHEQLQEALAGSGSGSAASAGASANMATDQTQVASAVQGLERLLDEGIDMDGQSGFEEASADDSSNSSSSPSTSKSQSRSPSPSGAQPQASSKSPGTQEPSNKIAPPTKEQLMKVVADQRYDVDTRLKALNVVTQHASMNAADMQKVSEHMPDMAAKAKGDEVQRFVEQASRVPTQATQSALQSLVKGGQCSSSVLCQIFSIMQKANNSGLDAVADDIARGQFAADKSDKTRACALNYLAVVNKDMASAAVTHLAEHNQSPELAPAVLRAADIILRGPQGQDAHTAHQLKLAPHTAWFKVQLAMVDKLQRARPLGFLSLLAPDDMVDTLVAHLYDPLPDIRQQVAFASSRIARPAALEILFSLYRFETEERAKQIVEARLKQQLERCPSCLDTIKKVYLKSKDQNDQVLAQKAATQSLSAWPEDLSPWPFYEE